jgi:hypothetical protein
VSVKTRRGFLALTAACGLCSMADAKENVPFGPPKPFRPSPPVPDVVEDVTPKAGVPTGTAFGDSVQRLAAAGVIEPAKFRKESKHLPQWVERVLTTRSDDPIIFSAQTAPYLVDLLWPIGLANKTAFNMTSPINTVSIPSFASTAGWTLGRAENGYGYFNSVEAVDLSDDQEAVVRDVAGRTFRPCCDNSTFFQDCNHGSALLGLLELAASQGATREGLYGLALIANSYWFPEYYAKTALLFAHFYRARWRDIPPDLILAPKYSTLSGWAKNVDDRLAAAHVALPERVGRQQSC